MFLLRRIKRLLDALRALRVFYKTSAQLSHMNEKEEKMSSIKERDVCRLVIERNEVLSSQIKSLVIEAAGSKLDQEELKNLFSKVEAAQISSTDGTVGAISKLFSK